MTGALWLSPQLPFWCPSQPHVSSLPQRERDHKAGGSNPRVVSQGPSHAAKSINFQKLPKGLLYIGALHRIWNPNFWNLRHVFDSPGHNRMSAFSEGWTVPSEQNYLFIYCLFLHHGQFLAAVPSLFLIGPQISESCGRGPTFQGWAPLSLSPSADPLTLSTIITFGMACDLNGSNQSGRWEFAGNIGTWTLLSWCSTCLIPAAVVESLKLPGERRG